MRYLLILLFALLSVPASGGDTESWEFAVTLDGDPIGFHRFEVVSNGAGRRVSSEARFDVRFLFFTAYRYRHEATEIWRDGCLERLSASTQTNKQSLAVSGELRASGFIVARDDSERQLGDCVQTFAYWDRDFLDAAKLLNPQTGEYLPISVQALPNERIRVRDAWVDASVYRLTAKNVELTLWYAGDEWLALESTAKGGRLLRYELA